VALDLQGFGVLNWLMKKMIQSEVEQNITNLLMTSGRELLQNKFSEVSLIDEMFTTFKIL
jgi:hypothetical protein